MILGNNYCPTPKFWSENFLNEFSQLNSEDTIATLLWHKDENIITKQIEYAITNKADIIISEILLDELPESVLLSEYEILTSKLVFVPPHFDITIITSDLNNDSILIFSDDKFEFNILSKFEQFSHCDSGEDLDQILKCLNNSSKVIINTKYQQLNHFIILWCINHNIPFAIDIDSSYYSRYPASGITLDYNTIDISHGSVRLRINNYLKNKFNKGQIANEQLIEPLLGKFNCRYFDTLKQNPCYQHFVKGIYNNDLDENLWIRTWACFSTTPNAKTSNIYFSRYRKNFIFSILNQSQNDLRYDFDTKNYVKYLVEYLLQHEPSIEWRSEINLLLVHFPEVEFKFESIFMELQSKGLVHEKIPYLYIICEEIIFASNDRKINEQNKILLLKKATKLIDSAKKLTKLNSEKYEFLPQLINSYNSNCNEFIDNFATELANSSNKSLKKQCNILELLPTFFKSDVIIEKFTGVKLNQRQNTSIISGIWRKYNYHQMYNAYYWYGDIFSKSFRKDIQKFYEFGIIKEMPYYQQEINNLCVSDFLEISDLDLARLLFVRGASIDHSLVETILQKFIPTIKFPKIVKELLVKYLNNNSNKISILNSKFTSILSCENEHPQMLIFNILNSTIINEVTYHTRISESLNYCHHNMLKSFQEFIKFD